MMKKFVEDGSFRRRLVMCVLGLILSCAATGFLKRAAFGVDPFQSFITGLNTAVPVSYGMIYMITCVLLLVFVLLTDRHYIGIGTVINLFFAGYIVDYSQKTLFYLFPNLKIFGRMVFFVIGIILMCFSASLYFTADMGVSAYDAVALIISRTWKKGQFRWVRILTDLVCVICGSSLYLLSGGTGSGLLAVVSVGTIVTALFMGPLVDLFDRKVSQPILQGEFFNGIRSGRNRWNKNGRRGIAPVYHR